jgi:hypothetical protein
MKNISLHKHHHHINYTTEEMEKSEDCCHLDIDFFREALTRAQSEFTAAIFVDGRYCRTCGKPIGNHHLRSITALGHFSDSLQVNKFEVQYTITQSIFIAHNY